MGQDWRALFRDRMKVRLKQTGGKRGNAGSAQETLEGKVLGLGPRQDQGETRWTGAGQGRVRDEYGTGRAQWPSRALHTSRFL